MNVVYKGRGDGADAESQCDGRKKPARTDPFARDLPKSDTMVINTPPGSSTHVARDLKNDIGDEEDRQHGIVIVVDESEVFAEPGEFRIS